jgi:hypothetical protein
VGDEAQDSAALEKTAYEAALRALAGQADEFNQMRSRTGTLLAAGSITTSFLGAQAVGHGPLGFFGGAALVAFVSFLLPCIYVLLPKRDFIFSISGTVLYENLYEFRREPAEFYRRLTYWLQGFWEHNQQKIESVTRFFLWGAISLTAQIALWALALRATLA